MVVVETSAYLQHDQACWLARTYGSCGCLDSNLYVRKEEGSAAPDRSRCDGAPCAQADYVSTTMALSFVAPFHDTAAACCVGGTGTASTHSAFRLHARVQPVPVRGNGGRCESCARVVLAQRLRHATPPRVQAKQEETTAYLQHDQTVRPCRLGRTYGSYECLDSNLYLCKEEEGSAV